MTAPVVAASDCERIHPGLIGQPANTVSSLAFMAAAMPIARAARLRRRPASLAVATAATVEGFGSAAYHGPGGRQAKRLHDVGIVALVGTMAVAVASEGTPVHRRPRTHRDAGHGGGGPARAQPHGGPLCSCRSPLQGHALFHVLAAAALAAAGQQR